MFEVKFEIVLFLGGCQRGVNSKEENPLSTITLKINHPHIDSKFVVFLLIEFLDKDLFGI